MPRIELNITSWDISKGYRGSPDACPASRAYRKHGFQAYVGKATTSIYGEDGDCVIIPHTSAMKRFIKDFDAGKPVKPFKATVQWKAK